MKVWIQFFDRPVGRIMEACWLEKPPEPKELGMWYEESTLEEALHAWKTHPKYKDVTFKIHPKGATF